MLAPLITKIGAPVLVNILSDVLRGVDNPLTQGAAAALKQVDAALKSGDVDAQALQTHLEKMAQIESDEHKAQVSQVNQSLRAEVASEDAYVRRMRPTFGYLMAITWAAQMMGLAYVIVFETAQAGAVLNAMSSLSAIWAVGLSVLGIYVYKRSEDKKLIPRPPGPETIFWNR
ncbi:MAG: holin family protein [Alphaproteobacteria bacterium]|nr:holin family protein [Alphaproteobacteria bacterium]